MTAFNFNRYGIEGSRHPDTRFHITVRLNVNKDEALCLIEEKLEHMKNQRTISDWRPEDNTYDIKPMRDYSRTYHTAHETSTACAIRFWSELRKNPTELQRFLQNSNQYLEPFF